MEKASASKGSPQAVAPVDRNPVPRHPAHRQDHKAHPLLPHHDRDRSGLHGPLHVHAVRGLQTRFPDFQPAGLVPAPQPLPAQFRLRPVERRLWPYLANTFVVTAALTIGQVFFSILGAFAFARLSFPGRDLIFWLFLLTLMVPSAVTVIPLYTIM
jgi:ABC-type glycerol-3-phosphate transport system permease component